MTDSKTILQTVEKFIQQFDNDELDFAEAKNESQQNTLDSLAKAITAFKVSSKDLKSVNSELDISLFKRSMEDRTRIRSNYSMALSNLSQLIIKAKMNKLFFDKKESPELTNMKNLNSILTTQKNQLQTVLDKIFEEYPVIREKYKPLLKSNIVKEEGRVE